MTAFEVKSAAALAAAAKAFARAQIKGYVWIGEQGTFETCEGWLDAPAPKVLHPDYDQLTLA